MSCHFKHVNMLDMNSESLQLLCLNMLKYIYVKWDVLHKGEICTYRDPAAEWLSFITN